MRKENISNISNNENTVDTENDCKTNKFEHIVCTLSDYLVVPKGTGAQELY